MINRKQMNTMSRELKVLYHSRTFATGGARVHIDCIVKQLRLLGCEVDVVEPISGGRHSRKAVLLSAMKEKLPAFLSEIIELLYSVKAYRELCLYKKVALIYERHALFNLAGALYAKYKKKHFFLEVNSPLAYEREKYQKLFFKQIAYRLEKYVLNSADKVFCVSEKLKSILIDYGIRENKIIVNHNGIDSDYTIEKKDIKLVKKYNLEGKIVIGFAGYMIAWHGGDVLISTLIKLFEKYENVVFLLVGGIDYDVDLEQIIKYKKRFFIIPNVEHNNIYNYINLFDIGVMAQSNEYGSPMKLIEYMGLGKAVIGPETSAVKELIDGQDTGLLVKSGNEKDLYDKMEWLIKNEKERKRIGKNSRKFILDNKMTWQDNANRIIFEFKLLN